MHYTGMAAASVICTTENRRAMLPDLMASFRHAALVLTIALGIRADDGSDRTIQRLKREQGGGLGRSNAGRARFDALSERPRPARVLF